MRRLFILLGVLPSLVCAQYSISGSFSPAEDYTYAFLYKATPEGANYVDRAQLDSLGNFSITLDSAAEAGIYKIVYAIPPEENNFDIVFNGKENVNFNFSLENGIEFTESSENKLWNSYHHSMEMVNQTISNYFTKNAKDEAGFNSIFKTLTDTQNSYEELAKGKLVEVFIQSNKPYIPKQFEDISTYADNLKTHHFKNVAFDNDLLRSSRFISDRVSDFVFSLPTDTKNDTYKDHVSIVANAIASYDANIQMPVLELLWQEFKRRENHDLANFISDSYLLAIAKRAENKVLEQQLVSYKNTSVGATAPDFEITSAPELKLSQLRGEKYYVLVFWSSGCSHCLKELPKVKTLMETVSGAKVVAYGLENDDVKWREEVSKYPDFVHGMGLGKWEHPLVQTYAIAATPTYFVLDANKTIVAKPYDFEALEQFFKAI